VRIESPNGKILYDKKHTREDIVSVDLKEIGVYKLLFSNEKSLQTKDLAVAVRIKEESTLPRDDLEEEKLI